MSNYKLILDYTYPQKNLLFFLFKMIYNSDICSATGQNQPI